MNWKKLIETSLSVGVAIAASVIGDKFVAKAAKSITAKDEDANAEHTDEVVEVTEEIEETEETEETED